MLIVEEDNDLWFTVPFCSYLRMTEAPETVAHRPPLRTAPRIAGFKGPTTDSQYYIIVEQVLCSVAAFSKAFMLWFLSHYIFNLEYCKQAKDVALFMQEFVFGLPTHDKKSGTYLSVTTDIQSYVENDDYMEPCFWFNPCPHFLLLLKQLTGFSPPIFHVS